ncbi:hypothetical protein [Nocardioides convexus]|uniref:hypothetical protein n=1 Tax=Nocardioides convexus TaxID=2712224 RepID=UPI002418271B|nr:hypothetical protein [Nocardioides convexus]
MGVALKEAETPFALAGGYGLWARGGPEPEHDVDFMVAEEDAARVRDLLAARDLVVVQPPEDWLFKVFIDEAMVDVIFRVDGETITRDRFDAAEVIEVESVRLPVLPATVLLADKASTRWRSTRATSLRCCRSRAPYASRWTGPRSPSAPPATRTPRPACSCSNGSPSPSLSDPMTHAEGRNASLSARAARR